MSLACW